MTLSFRQRAFPVHALALMAFASPMAAQDTTATELAPVVVSASKAGGPANQAVTVISGEQLRATGVNRVSDALRLVPAAAVVGGGAVGSVTSLFLRGGESRYVKVLLDGVAINSVGGYFDFSHLTTANIDRIEIVRGPASVVYGADAMTGVIHIFTRQGSGGSAVEADMRGGSYGTREGSVAVLGGGERARYSAAGARQSTDGILPFNNQYWNRTLSGSLRYAPDAASSVELATRLGHVRYHYPTDFLGFVEDSNSFRDQERLTLALNAARQLSDRIELRFLAGANAVTDVTDDIEPLPPWMEGEGDIHSRYRTRTHRRHAELRGTFRLPLGALTSGAEYIRETERSIVREGMPGDPLQETSSFAGTRETRVGFAELSGRAAFIDYVLSARLDRPSDFGSFGTYRVGLGSRIGAVRLRASAGTAFNAPSFSQLLPTEFTTGSPDLDPERVRAVDAGIDLGMARERVRLSVTRFDQRFLDLIQFVGGSPPDFLGSFANLAAATSRGWEVDLRAVPAAGWELGGSFTRLSTRISRLDERYEGSLQVGEPLVRRPPRSAAGSISFTGWEGGVVGLTVRHVGRRPDLDFREFPAPAVHLPAYTVADFSSVVRLMSLGRSGALSLTARVENLFDREYEEILYYPAPGRTLLVGARAEVGL